MTFTDILLGLFIGLVVSMISVLSVDFDKMVVVALGLMMWITPVIYSENVDNQLVQTLISWNPLTYLVCSARDIIIYGRLFDTAGYFFCSGLSLIVFMVAWRLFYVSEDKIIERMI